MSTTSTEYLTSFYVSEKIVDDEEFMIEDYQNGIVKNVSKFNESSSSSPSQRAMDKHPHHPRSKLQIAIPSSPRSSESPASPIFPSSPTSPLCNVRRSKSFSRCGKLDTTPSSPRSVYDIVEQLDLQNNSEKIRKFFQQSSKPREDIFADSLTPVESIIESAAFLEVNAAVEESGLRIDQIVDMIALVDIIPSHLHLVKTIAQFYPNHSVIYKIVQTYTKKTRTTSPENSNKIDILYMKLSMIPLIRKTLQVWIFIAEYPNTIAMITRQLDVVEKAFEVLRNSNEFHRIVGIICQIVKTLRSRECVRDMKILTALSSVRNLKPTEPAPVSYADYVTKVLLEDPANEVIVGKIPEFKELLFTSREIKQLKIVEQIKNVRDHFMQLSDLVLHPIEEQKLPPQQLTAAIEKFIQLNHKSCEELFIRIQEISLISHEVFLFYNEEPQVWESLFSAFATLIHDLQEQICKKN